MISIALSTLHSYTQQCAYLSLTSFHSCTTFYCVIKPCYVTSVCVHQFVFTHMLIEFIPSVTIVGSPQPVYASGDPLVMLNSYCIHYQQYALQPAYYIVPVHVTHSYCHISRGHCMMSSPLQYARPVLQLIAT